MSIDYYHMAEFKKVCVYYGFLCFLIIWVVLITNISVVCTLLQLIVQK